MIKYGLLTADDEMASEHEVYDFLYALVRLLKPKVILETGCYKGGAARRMAEAALLNEIGHVYTCDTDSAWAYAMDDYRESLPISSDHRSGEAHCKALVNVDLAFIDSSGDRVEEIRNLQLTPNAVVVLHDSKRPQYRPIWALRPWKMIWEIDTEQGLAVFQL